MSVIYLINLILLTQYVQAENFNKTNFDTAEKYNAIFLDYFDYVHKNCSCILLRNDRNNQTIWFLKIADNGLPDGKKFANINFKIKIYIFLTILFLLCYIAEVLYVIMKYYIAYIQNQIN